jgi:hypothetical protein
LLSEAQRATLRETLWQQAHRKCDRADVIASLDDLKSYVAYLQTFNENWGGVARYLADADARNQLGFSSEQERRRQTIVAACKAVLDESVAEMQKLSPPEQASRGNDFKTKIDRAYRDVQAQIEGLLTPQQAPAFKEIVMRMHVRSLPDDGETFNVITAATQQKAAARQIWEQQESESRRIFAETRAQRLSLLTAAELQRLREAIDRNDWTELVPRFGPSYR